MLEEPSGDLNDIPDDGTVPTIALKLFAAATRETQRVTDDLREMANRKAEAQSLRAQVAESDLRVVRQLHEMLHDPKYARRLVSLLFAGDEWED